MAQLPTSKDRQHEMAGKPPRSFRAAIKVLELASELVKLANELLRLFGIS